MNDTHPWRDFALFLLCLAIFIAWTAVEGGTP